MIIMGALILHSIERLMNVNLRWVFVIVLILSLLHGAVLLDNTGRVADLGVTILMVISISLGIMTVVWLFWNEGKTKPGVRGTNKMGIKQ